MDKLNPNDAFKKNIFRPDILGVIPNKIPIPNHDGVEVNIDLFLNSINLPKNWLPEDCALHLHTSHRNELLEKARLVSGFSGRFTRYRDFLLVFDNDISEGLFYVCSIFDEIENLRRLQNEETYEFSMKELHILEYLIKNRFKRD